MHFGQATTHDKHQNMVITLSANSYTIFWALSGADFGFSKYCERVWAIFGGKIRIGDSEYQLLPCLRNKSLQGGQDVLVVHLTAQLVPAVDGQIPEIQNGSKR